MNGEYGGFLARIARRHSIAAFGRHPVTAPIVVQPFGSIQRACADGEPETPASIEALEAIERTARCMSAAERMAERFRRR